MRSLLAFISIASSALAGCAQPNHEAIARQTPPAITFVGSNYDALVACVWKARSKRLFYHYPRPDGYVFRFSSRGIEGLSNVDVTVFRDGGPPRAQVRQYGFQIWSARDQRLTREVRDCAAATETDV